MQDPTKIDISAADDETIIQLIIFCAGNEEFGVKIDSVREIIKIGTITPIPDSPPFIKGIINVRGEIVTAVDIKSRFSLPDNKNTGSKHIIVTKQEDSLFGLIVDEVIEILRIMKKDINPPPSLITGINDKYISGVITHHDRLIIILDLNLVLSHKELINFSNIKKMNLIEKKYKHHKKIKNRGSSQASTETDMGSITSSVPVIPKKRKT